MEQKKEEEKTLIVSSDYYSSSYIVNKVYLVTIKRYTMEHSLMIVDTTRADEHITIPLLSAIYRNLSRPDTDSLMITSFSQKLNRMDLVEIDTFNLLENNKLQLKIPIRYEDEEKKKKENLHSGQSRRNSPVRKLENYCDSCKHLGNHDYCGDCICDFDIPNSKPSMYEMSASNNTERR